MSFINNENVLRNRGSSGPKEPETCPESSVCSTETENDVEAKPAGEEVESLLSVETRSVIIVQPSTECDNGNADTESNKAEEEWDYGCISQNMVDRTEVFVRNIWNVCSFQALPRWLQDNDYLRDKHRPPLNSFIECCKSIFRIHTETVNIWTHLLGVFLFAGIYIDVLITKHYNWQDKLIFAVYFVGTIICLGLSTAFHVLHCHSEYVGRLFNKLDYCGIAVLIMVSFVPWLYYCFYCYVFPIIMYMSTVTILGTCSIIVSLWDKYATPSMRPLRTAVFITFGLSGVVPAMHYLYLEGSVNRMALASVGWLSLMGALYIIGAIIYALRVPERLYPGKFDILFQSHQIFHVFVLVAAFVHYYGITQMAAYRINGGGC